MLPTLIVIALTIVIPAVGITIAAALLQPKYPDRSTERQLYQLFDPED